jgi:type VI secretion system protein ImpC
MSERLMSLLAGLRNVRMNLAAEDVADVLWLAPYLAGSGVVAASPRAGRIGPAEGARSSHSTAPPEPPTVEPAAPLPVPLDPRAGRSRGDHRGAIYLPAPGSAPSGGGRPVQVPTGSPLPGSLALARSLRPLRRRVASRKRVDLDVEQTVRRVAEERLWLPALRPARDRWLDLALVVDGGASMGLWRPLARELYRVLACTGAFRMVRLWGLDTDANPPTLHPGLARRPGLTARHPRELVDPTGRSLVLVLTDCVSKAWQDGAAARVLETWSARGPAALIHVLPEHLWSRTTLGSATAVRLSAPGPAVPNTRLTARLACPWDDAPAVRPGSAVPVASLEPGQLAAFAAVVAGVGGALAAGFFLDLEPPPPPSPRRTVVTPYTRLSQFWEVASPTARRLAGLLAAAPAVTLPIVRLVRQAMLPEARQVHEAEVLLGGLLKVVSSSTPGAVEPDPDDVRYDFHDGLRPLLLDAVPTADARDVLEKVSAYVAEHLGHGRDFRAVLADPTAAGASIEPDTSPVARVAAEVMMRLGGEHARLVTRGPALRGTAGSGTSGSPVTAKFGPQTLSAQEDQGTLPPPRPAGAKSLQHKLDRIRPPRVQITYDVETEGALMKVELPFVIGVLADLSGHRQTPTAKTKFVEINRDTFNSVLERISPALALWMPDRLANDGTKVYVNLRFRSIDDFEPEAIVAMCTPLSRLLEARQRLFDLRLKLDVNDALEAILSRILIDDELTAALAEQMQRVYPSKNTRRSGWTPTDPSDEADTNLLDQVVEVARPGGGGDAGPIIEVVRILVSDPRPLRGDQDLGAHLKERIAGIDRTLSAQVAEILHHAEFQRLEATWRGLHYLVHQTETGATLKIKVLNLSKTDLLRQQEKVSEFDQSFLFKAVYDDELGTPGGQPYGLLVGDYQFDHTDSSLLSWIAAIAAASHAPFIAAASPAMFGFDSFTDLPIPRDLAEIFRGSQYEKWRSFRRSEDSRYLGLTLPRILLRLPYGTDGRPIEAFDFQEFGGAPEHSQLLWGSAAWAFATRVAESYAKYGWLAAVRGMEGGGRVGDLPLHTYATDDGDIVAKCPTEVLILDRREFELGRLGFLPLSYYKGTEYAVFLTASSCQSPKMYDSDAATAVAHTASQLHMTLCLSRFAHYLMAICRDRIGSFMSPKDMEHWLNGWIMTYVTPDDAASMETKRKYPLRDAVVRVEQAPGRPGVYQAVAYLRPHYLLDELTAALRVVVTLPGEARYIER